MLITCIMSYRHFEVLSLEQNTEIYAVVYLGVCGRLFLHIRYLRSGVYHGYIFEVVHALINYDKYLLYNLVHLCCLSALVVLDQHVLFIESTLSVPHCEVYVKLIEQYFSQDEIKHVLHLIRENMSNQGSINRDQSFTVGYVSMFGGNVTSLPRSVTGQYFIKFRCSGNFIFMYICWLCAFACQLYTVDLYFLFA